MRSSALPPVPPVPLLWLRDRRNAATCERGVATEATGVQRRFTICISGEVTVAPKPELKVSRLEIAFRQCTG